MITINAHPGSFFSIGRQGEHLARQIRIDISSWEKDYGPGTVELIFQRPGDAAPYPVSLQRDGSHVLWGVTSTDTEFAGRDARAEMRYYSGNALVKSATSAVAVSPAMDTAGAKPETPGQNWLDQVLEAGADAKAGARAAEASRQAAEEIVNEMKGQVGGNGLTAEQLIALDGMFKIAAYITDDTTYYSAFQVAFGLANGGGGVPDDTEVTLKGISATRPIDVAVGTPITSIPGIVVRALYSDGRVTVVTDYTLESNFGEYIVEGLNMITIRYSGKSIVVVVEGVADSGDGDVHTHSYTSAVTTAATCDTDGVRTCTCSCGHSYTEAIPAIGHNYVDGTCTKCGAADPNYDAGGDEPETTEPVYRLAEATTFNADHVVDTGYKLLDVEKSWSVCVDCTDSSKGGVVWDASPNASQGLTLTNRGGYYRTLMLGGSLYRDIGTAIGNYKIIVTHQKNTDLIEYHYIAPDTTELVSGEITYTKYLTDGNIIGGNPRTVKIGGNYDGSTASYKGTVHRVEIYERVLSEDEINEFVEFVNSGGNEDGDESGGEGSTEPVYKLATATTFDGTSGIDTGYKLLDKDKSWSVCVDFTGNGGCVWDASPNASKGMTLTHRGNWFRSLYAALEQVEISGGNETNHKVIVTHTKGTNSVQYHYIYEGASRVDSEVVKEEYLANGNIISPQTPLTVKLGANYSGTGDYYKGAIHRFEIYERVITADEINAFMGVTA